MLLTQLVEQRADALAVIGAAAQHLAQLALARQQPGLLQPRGRGLGIVQHLHGERRRDADLGAGPHHRLAHRDARPGRRHVDGLPLPADLQSPADLLGELDHQLLGQVHQRLVGGVGHVELAHAELGVVLAREPLVAEGAADLVDPVIAAHQQPLEVQLGSDAQLQVHVQGVVVGLEWFGRGAAQHRVQHRRLHLQKVPLIEEGADELDHVAALAEDLGHVRVGHQVHVPLAVAGLLVLEAAPLGRRRAHGLGQQAHLLCHDRQLAGPGEEGEPPGSQKVPGLGLLEDLVGLLAHHVPADIDLELAGAVGQLDEGRLAEAAELHGASSHREALVAQGLGLPARLLGGLGVREQGQHLPGRVGGCIPVAVRVFACLAQGLDLLLALLHQAVDVHHLFFGGLALLLTHCCLHPRQGGISG